MSDEAVLGQKKAMSFQSTQHNWHDLHFRLIIVHGATKWGHFSLTIMHGVTKRGHISSKVFRKIKSGLKF
jgi:hypothetical protein